LKILDILFQLLSNPEPLWKSGSSLFAIRTDIYSSQNLVHCNMYEQSATCPCVCVFIPKKVMSVSRSQRSITLNDDLETLLAMYHTQSRTLVFSSPTEFRLCLQPSYQL